MSAVRVRATDIEDDTLPSVCVVTGQPATANWNVRYVNPAGALWLLLLFGVLPFVLARFLTRHEVQGLLPISSDGIATVRERRRSTLFGGLVALAFLAAGVGLGALIESWVVVLAGVLAAAAVWIVISIAFSPRVAGSVEQSGRWVRLDGVHPTFATAVAKGRAPVM